MQIELTQRGILTVLFRQQAKFLLVCGVMIAAGVLYLARAVPLYESYGSLLVRFGQNATPEVNQNDNRPNEISHNDRDEIMQSYADILQSHNLLQTLVKQIGAEKLYPGISARDRTLIPLEAAVKKLIDGDLIVRPSDKSNVVEILLYNQDPELAKAALGSLMKMFISRQSEVFNKPQMNFLNQQVEQAQSKLETSQKSLRDFKATIGISSIDDELQQLLKEKSDVATIAFQAATEAQTKLSDLQSQLATLLATYKYDSPMVEQVRESIDAAKKQLEQRQADVNSAQNPAKSKGSLAERIKNIEGRIADLESRRNQYNDLLRQVQIDEENYKNYQERREEARVNQTLNQESITRLSVVDDPVVSATPVRPRKKLVVLASVLAGLLFGFGFAFAFELLDERFSQPEQVLPALGIPLLATFSKSEKSKG